MNRRQHPPFLIGEYRTEMERDMIITVTMNPAIDKTLVVDRLNPGGLNRISASIIDAGGKGINVSKTIRMLGGETIAAGFLGRSGSQVILDCLSDLDIRQDFILVEGETRVNTKVAEANGRVTELNETGPLIAREQMNQLFEKLLSYAAKDCLFVFAGNVPRGVDRDVYARLIKAVKDKGARVFLDAEGDLFQYGVEAAPDIVKPNHIELAQYFGCDYEPEEEELIGLGKRLLEKGIRLVVISRGKDGALFITKERVASCRSLPVKVQSTVGAGDAMVAGLCYGLQSGASDMEAYRLGMAAATGAVMTPGTKPPGMDLVEELRKQLELTIVSDRHKG